MTPFPSLTSRAPRLPRLHGDVQQEQEHDEHGQEYFVHSCAPPQLYVKVIILPPAPGVKTRGGRAKEKTQRDLPSSEKRRAKAGVPAQNAAMPLFSGTPRGPKIFRESCGRGEASFLSAAGANGVHPGASPDPQRIGKPCKAHVVEENNGGSRAVEAEPDLSQPDRIEAWIGLDKV